MRAVGHLEPDGAPADVEPDRRRPAGAVHPGAGGRGRDQRRDRRRPTRRRPPRASPPGTTRRPSARWTSLRRSRTACIYLFLHTTGSRNYSGYSNPRLDVLLDRARQALTVKAAKALYREAQTIIVNARPMIYLYHAIKYAGVSTRVTGVTFYGDVMPRVDVRAVQVAAAMGGFLLRRAGAALVVVFAASVLVFLGMRALPGDPATALGGETSDPAVLAAIRHEYLLDRPLHVQYGRWLWLALHGNLGEDHSSIPVGHTIVTRLPLTLELAALEHARRRSHRHPRGGDRRRAARQGERLRRQDRGADRPVGAAFLAGAADDHLVRSRPALATRGRLCVVARSDREPAAHADALPRARRRVRGGPDAAGARVDADELEADHVRTARAKG